MDRPGRPPSLLESLQGLIERTYDIDRTIADIGRYVIGDRGYHRLVARHEVVRRVGAAAIDGPAVLLRQADGRWQASLYYPDWLVRRLERHPPLRRLDHRNLAPLALFVEELDHLLFLADRLRVGRPVTLIELEFHANVTKELVVRHFWARHRRRDRLSTAERRRVGHQVHGPIRFDHLPEDLRERYREASRRARDFLDWLDRQPAAARLHELRRFHRRGWQQNLRFMWKQGGPERS